MPFDPLFFLIGFSVTCGWFLFMLCVQIVISLLSVLTPRDDSDAPKGKRSGFKILTDELTGVQYLQVGIKGPVTLRVDSSGYPVVSKTKQTR